MPSAPNSPRKHKTQFSSIPVSVLSVVGVGDLKGVVGDDVVMELYDGHVSEHQSSGRLNLVQFTNDTMTKQLIAWRDTLVAHLQR